MKTFDKLLEKLRQELTELIQEKGNLKGNEEVVRKSQELDEFLNSFYAPVYSGVQNFTARNHKTVKEIVTTALYKKGLTDNNLLLKLRELCGRMGKKLNLASAQRGNLDFLALMHDLGMLLLPGQILFKKEPFTAKEFNIIRQHPEKGFRIALFLEELPETADLILKHHEHWDGGGYPRGLAGEEIPLECRIFAIVDAYCAMISGRPYRQALNKEEALAELKHCAGSQFDPGLVKVFSELVDCGLD